MSIYIILYSREYIYDLIIIWYYTQGNRYSNDGNGSGRPDRAAGAAVNGEDI